MTERKLTVYDRFSDRARKVMQLANQEAKRFNHDYIAPEHIFLGLLKEGSGVAATVIKNMNIDLRRLRVEIEKFVPVGPNMVSMGKLPKTKEAQKVIDNAIAAARELENNYVGTEHLLLGLLELKDEHLLPAILAGFNLTVDVVKKEVRDLLGLTERNVDEESSGHPFVPTANSKPEADPTDVLAFAARVFRDKLGPMLQKEVDEKHPGWLIVTDATLELQRKVQAMQWSVAIPARAGNSSMVTSGAIFDNVAAATPSCQPGLFANVVPVDHCSATAVASNIKDSIEANQQAITKNEVRSKISLKVDPAVDDCILKYNGLVLLDVKIINSSVYAIHEPETGSVEKHDFSVIGNVYYYATEPSEESVQTTLLTKGKEIALTRNGVHLLPQSNESCAVVVLPQSCQTYPTDNGCMVVAFHVVVEQRKGLVGNLTPDELSAIVGIENELPKQEEKPIEKRGYEFL